jgi:hypothetical protein
MKITIKQHLRKEGFTLGNGSFHYGRVHNMWRVWNSETGEVVLSLPTDEFLGADHNKYTALRYCAELNHVPIEKLVEMFAY